MIDTSEQEVRAILKRLKTVKEAGFGELLIQVKDGKVVYIKHSIGEQMKFEMEGK